MRKKALNKVARKWIAALRSGKFKQTRGQLGRGSGSRCCLGVLCDLAVKAKVIDGYDLMGPSLPDKVRLWAGLRTEEGGYVTGKYEQRDLTRDNDGARKSFARIADIIESQPQGLFAE